MAKKKKRTQKKIAEANPKPVVTAQQPNVPVGLSMLGVFVLVVIVYGCTAPETIALEDDGDFVFSVFSFGIAHPPGYPLFVWLAKPFTWLPFGEYAWRVHMASAAFGAATCSAIWWIAQHLTRRQTVAWLAALGYGFSGAFWSQAIVAEIYTLNTLVFFALMALALAWVSNPRPKLIWAIGLIYGLGLANHWPLLVLATPALALIVLPKLNLIWREAPKAAALMLLGLLPYLWMYFRSQAHPEFGFYGAMQNWEEFWFVVSREGYASVDQSATAGPLDKLGFLGFLGTEALMQFTPLGAALAGVGVWAQWKRWGLFTALGMLFAFLSASLFLVLLLNFDYEYLGRSLFRVYPLIPWGIMALWMALGASFAIDWLEQRRQQIARPVSVAAVVLIIAATLATHFSANSRRGYDYARDYATTILNALEKNAILFTMGDVDAYTLRYYRYVLGMRPDVTLVAQNGVSFTEQRLFNPRQTDGKKQAEIVTAFAKTQTRPVYFVHGEPPSMTGVNMAAIQKALVPTGAPKTIYSPNAEIMAMLERIAATTDSDDPWTIRHRRIMMNVYGSWLTHVVHLHPDRSFQERYGPTLDRLSESVYSVAMTRIGILKGRDAKKHAALIRKLHEQAGQLMDNKISKSNRSIWWNYHGQFLKEDGKIDEAREAFETAYDINRNPNGSSVYYLLDLAAATGDCALYSNWRDRYNPEPLPKQVSTLDRRMDRQCGR